jgi:hypothetical protein
VAIEFYCKSCKKRLRCPDSAAGTKARCPQCSEINDVPLVSDPPAMSPAPGAADAVSSVSSDAVAVSPPPWQPPQFDSPAPQPPAFSPPAFSPPSSSPPSGWGSSPGAPDDLTSGKAVSGEIIYPQKGDANPYASPQGNGGMPLQPTDQSGMASSLGVVSIIVGGMSLVFGCCCAPISAVAAFSALGLGIWGLVAANAQLKQTKYAPYLRHLEPPAKTAQILCVIGIVISGLSSLIFGAFAILMLISALTNSVWSLGRTR